jgi:hypothetical protein
MCWRHVYWLQEHYLQLAATLAVLFLYFLLDRFGKPRIEAGSMGLANSEKRMSAETV